MEQNTPQMDLENVAFLPDRRDIRRLLKQAQKNCQDFAQPQSLSAVETHPDWRSSLPFAVFSRLSLRGVR